MPPGPENTTLERSLIASTYELPVDGKRSERVPISVHLSTEFFDSLLIYAAFLSRRQEAKLQGDTGVGTS